MNTAECPFEAQALAAVVEGCWPLQAESSLREHVAQCAVCREVVALAGTFELAKQNTHALATPPDASRVWWMAQMRARREAAQEAARPILATQIAACIWIVGLLIVCAGAALAWFHAVVATLLLNHGVLIGMAAAVVLLLPTAAYFAMGRE